MFARTERLLLRPGFPEDAPALVGAIADEAIGTDEHVVVDSAVGNSVKVHKV